MAAKPLDVMIDIETLDTDIGAVILSIGACRFNANGIRSTYERSISIDSCLEAGLSVDGDTLEWWLDQSDEAQEVLSGGDGLQTVLSDFAGWIKATNTPKHGEDRPPKIWANSPSFDCVQLEHAYRALGMDIPWDYSDRRDYRTLQILPLDPEVDHNRTAHSAVDDAVYQAKKAQKALQFIEQTQQWELSEL